MGSKIYIKIRPPGVPRKHTQRVGVHYVRVGA